MDSHSWHVMLFFFHLISQPSSHTCCYLSLRSRFECISHFPPHCSYLESSRYLSDSTPRGRILPVPKECSQERLQLLLLILAAAEPTKLYGLAFFPFLSLAVTGITDRLTNYMTALSPWLRQRQQSVQLHSLISRKNCIKIAINTVLIIFI